jgi:MFS family permease
VRLLLRGESASALVVPTLIAAQFAGPFMFSGVAVALPAMGVELNAGATSLGLVETLFLAGSVALLLPVGRLADASDKRTLYKLGTAAFAVTSLAIALFSSIAPILVLRFLQGATSSVVAATGPALIAELVPRERRGAAYGLMIGAVYAGLTLGPVAAGFLIDYWGWRAVFWAGGALILAGYVVIAPLLRSTWKRPPPGAVHLPSSALAIAAMLLLAIGCSTLRTGWFGAVTAAAGIVLSALFVVWQRRLEEPLLNVDVLMRNVVLRDALLVQLLIYTQAFCSVFMLSIYMQVVLGIAAKISGQVLAVGSLLMALIAPLAGALADRYRAAAVASLGVGIAFASAVLAVALDERSGLVFVAVMLAVQGIGFAFFSSPNMTTVMNAVPPTRTAIASALSAQARTLGMMAGMLVTAAAISIHIGDAPLERDPLAFVQTMTSSFVVLAAISLAALALSVASFRRAPS